MRLNEYALLPKSCADSRDSGLMRMRLNEYALPLSSAAVAFIRTAVFCRASPAWLHVGRQFSRIPCSNNLLGNWVPLEKHRLTPDASN